LPGRKKLCKRGRSLGPAFLAENKGVFWGFLETRSSMRARMDLAQHREDTTAIFAWGRILERFLSGDLPGAQRALRKGRRESRFVEQFLRFQRTLPTDMPETYVLGSDEEAIISLAYLSGAWADHPLAS
jgi:hypothetical protein